MFIHTFRLDQCVNKGESVEVQLPRPGLVLDPRPNNHQCRWVHERQRYLACECLVRVDYHDDGVTVTLTRIDDNGGLRHVFSMRVYDPAIETVPRFDTTFYRYFGQDGEVVPLNTTHIIIDPSVKTIREDAFRGYDKLKWCKMHDGVEKIEQKAFLNCTSLEALFLPSSVTEIGYAAFYGCRNLRILSIPPDIDIDEIGRDIFSKCDTFFQTTHKNHMQQYYNSHRVHQVVINFYRKHPPLHKTCLSCSNLSAQAIHDCIDTHGRDNAYTTDHNGMTPLHILAINPHADTLAIFACFEANMNALFVHDDRNKTPLDYLRENNEEGYFYLIRDLCVHREAHLKVVEDGASSSRKAGSDTGICTRSKKKRKL